MTVVSAVDVRAAATAPIAQPNLAALPRSAVRTHLRVAP